MRWFNTVGLLMMPCIILLLAGCRGMGTQRFTAFAPRQTCELVVSSRTILDVRCANVVTWADYNLWDDLHMLAPKPKRWESDVTFEVERVVAGEFSETTIRFRLRDPTPAQSETLGIPYRGWGALTNGMPVRIGFDA